jgi:pyrimidine deaminase RibD-like protein
MKTSDFEIHNYKKLDKILLKLCEMVIDKHHGNPKLDGLVGAAVLDPNNNIVTGISTKSGDKWIHAEREALGKYESKYGEVPKGSIIVTTLSPCNDVMGNRYSKSCTDLINNSPVKKVYCGYIDPTQTNDQRKFTQLESSNKSVRELCKKISNIFLEKKDDFIKESQWKFARPAKYDRELLSEALEEYFKKDGKWYPNRVDAAVTLIRNGSIILENGSQFADDYKRFTEYLKNIDHRNKVKISIGANVSVLQFWPYPGDGVLEVRGHCSPKEITDIHYNDGDNIEWILFADGSSFPDETFHDRGFGGELDYITTLFFNTKRDAYNALLAAQLAAPDRWKMSTKNLKENVSLDETQELDEMPLPTGWDENELGSNKSFKSRLAYALQRAQRLGGGSARVAMIIDYEGRPTALKVAKNAKGMAQNEAEVNVLNDGYLGRLPIVIPLIDYDKKNPQPTWLQTELAKKVSSAKLATLLHCTHVWDFTGAVNAMLGRREKWGRELGEIIQDLKEAGKTEQDLDIFMDYVHEAADLINSSTVLIADLNQAANWGEYNGRPVILDVGFTEEVMPLYQQKVKRGWG